MLSPSYFISVSHLLPRPLFHHYLPFRGRSLTENYISPGDAEKRVSAGTFFSFKFRPTNHDGCHNVMMSHKKAKKEVASKKM